MMRNKSVIAIDLGSSFSKIAVRHDWNTEISPLRGLGLALPDESYCIPSTVVRKGTNGRGKWSFGNAAFTAPVVPGVDTIYRNWKRDMFDASTSEGVPTSIADEVPVRFLRAMRESLRDAGHPVNVPARICVPLLTLDGLEECRIAADAAREAGWDLCRDTPVLFEPASNAIGILSTGINSVTTPPRLDFQPWYPRVPNLPVMLPALSWTSREGPQSLLVLDIGAFTTDIGYVRCDGGGAEATWNVPEPFQKSVSLGMYQLEDRIIRGLGTAVADAWSALLPYERDNLFRRLLGGQPVSVRLPHGGSLGIGEASHQKQVATAVGDFGSRIAGAVSRFLSESALEEPRLFALTGGGSLVPSLRNGIISKLGALSSTEVDLLSRGAAEKVAKRVNDDTPAGVARHRERLGYLVRGGSAVGGCSVYFERLIPS